MSQLCDYVHVVTMVSTWTGSLSLVTFESGTGECVLILYIYMYNCTYRVQVYIYINLYII